MISFISEVSEYGLLNSICSPADVPIKKKSICGQDTEVKQLDASCNYELEAILCMFHNTEHVRHANPKEELPWEFF